MSLAHDEPSTTDERVALLEAKLEELRELYTELWTRVIFGPDYEL